MSNYKRSKWLTVGCFFFSLFLIDAPLGHFSAWHNVLNQATLSYFSLWHSLLSHLHNTALPNTSLKTTRGIFIYEWQMLFYPHVNLGFLLHKIHSRFDHFGFCGDDCDTNVLMQNSYCLMKENEGGSSEVDRDGDTVSGSRGVWSLSKPH